jgi:carboxylate-amine ligase
VKKRTAGYAPLSVVGLELEYAVVDASLRPACVVEKAFRSACGRPTSEVDRGPVAFSNELAAHVFETKMVRPRSDLAKAESELHAGIRYFADLLNEHFDMRLMPTGMHPLMRPRDTKVWRRAGRAIYDAYARVFDIHEHGWLNVQSSHVNLPFGGSERDLVLLHNAVSCLLPYLPALAASSPIVEGRLGPYLDNRLAFYRTNQRRIPAIAGKVIPEFVTSVADYRRLVLEPIYRALRRLRGTERLRHEWVNSRGAILRFERRALEIRVLDVQECVRMDVAIAIFIRAALRWMVRLLDRGELELPAHAMLVEDFEQVITDGRAARVSAIHLADGRRPHGRRAGDVLMTLLDRARRDAEASEMKYLDLVAERLATGSLSELIRARVRRRRSTTVRTAVRDVYEELIGALHDNRPWRG